MRIVLVNQKNDKDINVFSGTPHFMTAAIRQAFDDIVEIDLYEPADLAEKLSALSLQECLVPSGRQLSDLIEKMNPKADFVLCQGGNMAVPFYTGRIPLAYWHDSTWHTYLHAYSDKQKFAGFKQSYPKLYEWDKRALQKASLLLFSSGYVAEACMADYGISHEKIRIIPFGANINAPPSHQLLADAIEKRRTAKTLNLTFLGKDWQRKGLWEAYQLTELLNEMGIPTRLNAIGCAPALNDSIGSPHVKMYGFLDKSDRIQSGLFQSLLLEAHFLVHPATSEPYGISLCEANAHSVPVIGTTVEGLKTIVSNGRNGYLFDSHNFVHAAAATISSIAADLDGRYIPLCDSSFNEYRQRLNWQTGVATLKSMMQEFLPDQVRAF